MTHTVLARRVVANGPTLPPHIYGGGPRPYDTGTHMKLTLEICDSLLAEAKALAGDRGQTLREVIEASLRQWLASQSGRRRKFRLPDASVDGKGLRSGLSYDDWGKILDMSYGD